MRKRALTPSEQLAQVVVWSGKRVMLLRPTGAEVVEPYGTVGQGLQHPWPPDPVEEPVPAFLWLEETPASTGASCERQPGEEG